jgi:hypothetical protein
MSIPIVFLTPGKLLNEVCHSQFFNEDSYTSLHVFQFSIGRYGEVTRDLINFAALAQPLPNKPPDRIERRNLISIDVKNY